MIGSMALGIGYYLVGTGTITSMALAARGLTRAATALASGHVKLATAHVLEAALDPLLVAQRACKELGMSVGEIVQQSLIAGQKLADRVVGGAALPYHDTAFEQAPTDNSLPSPSLS
jgi:hypothetical protein